ncbi:MAG: hypothetical protein ACI8ZM_002184 [Crocinitomix sp.]|jgi:hypothetical protein
MLKLIIFTLTKMKILRKIGPLLLLPIVILSSIAFSFDVHFCKDSIKGISFFDAAGCEMNEIENNLVEATPCNKKCGYHELQAKEKKDGICKNNCCHNERFNYDVPGDIISANDAGVDLEIANIVLFYVLSDYYAAGLRTVEPVYQDYHPPQSKENLSILYQVFRI